MGYIWALYRGIWNKHPAPAHPHGVARGGCVISSARDLETNNIIIIIIVGFGPRRGQPPAQSPDPSQTRKQPAPRSPRQQKDSRPDKTSDPAESGPRQTEPKTSAPPSLTAPSVVRLLVTSNRSNRTLQRQTKETVNGGKRCLVVHIGKSLSVKQPSKET